MKKGVCRIPYFTNKLSDVTFSPGAQNYELRLSHGRLPHAVILTGQTQERYCNTDATRCLAKTTLAEEGFEIEEYKIFIDDLPSMGTPWSTPEQYYENLLRQIGRLDNYSTSGSVDFFKFRDNSWMIPLHFDERDNLTGQLSIKIKFKKPLEAAWKPIFMIFETVDCEIDTPKQSKFNLFCTLLLLY